MADIRNAQRSFEYLIGKSTGLERRSEVHELGLFTRAEMEAAFRSAGLSVEWRDAALRRRGAYVGCKPGPIGGTSPPP